MHVHIDVLTLKEVFLCHSSEFSVSSGSVELLEGQVVKWHHYYMAQGSYYNLYNFLHKACVFLDTGPGTKHDTDTRCDVTVRTMYTCCFVENDDEAFFLRFLLLIFILHIALS